MATSNTAAECAVLYSGGSDSTCVAALMAERFARVHLLTFEELATRGSPSPAGNVERLRAEYGAERFVHRLFSVDRLLERVSYERYWRNLRRHGLYLLSTPGFSSLSWHARTVAYCLDHGLAHAADGVTRELQHFPGHLDGVLRLFQGLYAGFGIDYRNPVRDWDVPPDQQFLERLLVSPHGFGPAPEASRARTTGAWLHARGLMPSDNVKGSALDQSMQHACYPFVLFNMFVFWRCLAYGDMAEYERREARLFAEKAETVRGWLEDYRRRGADSDFARWCR
jgi:hypothetical protein